MKKVAGIRKANAMDPQAVASYYIVPRMPTIQPKAPWLTFHSSNIRIILIGNVGKHCHDVILVELLNLCAELEWVKREQEKERERWHCQPVSQPVGGGDCKIPQ